MCVLQSANSHTGQMQAPDQSDGHRKGPQPACAQRSRPKWTRKSDVVGVRETVAASCAYVCHGHWHCKAQTTMSVCSNLRISQVGEGRCCDRPTRRECGRCSPAVRLMRWVQETVVVASRACRQRGGGMVRGGERKKRKGERPGIRSRYRCCLSSQHEIIPEREKGGGKWQRELQNEAAASALQSE